MLIDVYSRYLVGWTIAHREQARIAEVLIAESRQCEGIALGTLTLYVDRGSAMMSRDVALLLDDRGIRKIYSRLSVSNDNPFPMPSSRR